MTNRELFIHRYEAELPIFLRVFAALPADRLDWRPEPVARSAEELIGHLIGHEQDLEELLETGALNHRMQVPFAHLDEAVELFETAHASVVEKARAMDDETWDTEPSRFVVEGQVAYEMPYRDLAWLLRFDSIHHRGQLSTYIRPLGGKVPAMYGPSADTSVDP
jgi:uncharacterized damage-inducible protein DinB